MTYRSICALCLCVVLTACGSGNEDSPRISQVPSAFQTAANCMVVHTAILQAGFAPLGIAENAADAEGMIEGLRSTADSLPLDDAGHPTLRNAFRSIAGQVASIRGQGADAAATLTRSAPYRTDLDVLGAWSSTHCDSDARDDSSAP